MKLWLTLSAALIIPAAANAADFGKPNRFQYQIAELNERIEKLEADLNKARKVRSGLQSSHQTPAIQQPARPRARLNPNLVRMQAIPKDDPVETAALAPSNVIVTLTLPEITVSALPQLAPTLDVDDEEGVTAETADAQADDFDDFDPEASEDPLIRLDPETGKPMRVEPTPKAEPTQPDTACTDKTKCARAPLDKQAMATPTETAKSRRTTRLSWR
jgi:hypothetical protein